MKLWGKGIAVRSILICCALLTVGLLISAATAFSFQSKANTQTLPSHGYLDDDVVYFSTVQSTQPSHDICPPQPDEVDCKVDLPMWNADRDEVQYFLPEPGSNLSNQTRALERYKAERKAEQPNLNVNLAK